MVLLGVLVAVAAACSGSDGPIEPKNESASKAREDAVGKCLRFDEATDVQVQDLPVIPCTEPHTHEIYFVELNPEEVYPGFEKLEDQARLACLTAFDDYVGRSAFDSSLFYSWLVPTLDGWNDSKVDDRATLCVLGAGDGSLLTGTMKGANI